MLFWKVWFSIQMVTLCQILKWQKHKASDFELKIFFDISDLKMKTFALSDFESIISPVFYSSNLVPPHVFFASLFLDTTMSIYSPHFFRQLGDSIRHRSNNTSCTLFREDFALWSRFGVPLYSLLGFDICRNLLPLVNLMISMLQLLSLTHVWLGFQKS